MSEPSERDYFRGEVRRNVDLGAACWLLQLRVPSAFPAERVAAGQFVMLRGPWGRHPLLPRAFSILAASAGRLEILNKVVGRGTRRLAALREGDPVTVLGPLGRAFPSPKNRVAQVLVGGGSGIPPLLLHAQQSRAADPEAAVEILYGGRRAEDLVLLSRIESSGIRCEACTEDGSHGRAGRVTDALGSRLEQAGSPVEVLACGPLPMLRVVREMCADAGVRCLLSLETEMACGVGICRGCMVRRADGPGYLCTCLDGPVVDAAEVLP
jgi:dihydroorotate dehydrogenase electron transfer subunit